MHRIFDLCYSGNKLIPKRNINWVKSNHPKLYEKLILAFPETSIKNIAIYINAGIKSLEEIPGCSVCGNKVHISKNKLLTECSVSCSQKSKYTIEKIKNTCIQKYGCSRYFGDRNSYKLGEHYTHKNMNNIKDVDDCEIMERLSNSSWQKVAEHFGLTTNSHSSAFKFMKKHGYPIKSVSGKSGLELEIKKFVESLGVNCCSTKKIIPPYELDIYIPEKNLAIEFNGLYWHSSGSREDDKRLAGYHLMKTELCESKGIQLLHVFENEWTDPVKQAIWKSVIRHKLGLSVRIPARKCEIKFLKPGDINWFLNENHLQGSCNGASKALCLFHNDELVQVVTLGKPRYTKGYDWEILRMCTKLNTCIQGGFSKLVSQIEGSIVSYANRRWSYGNVYEVTGMTRKSVSSECYWYIDKDKLYHRSSFMKHKLKDRLANFDSTMTEVDNCYANGLRRIWDCGNLVYCKE